jgi:hypothetical protein
MTVAVKKGLVVALLHMLIVTSLGAKLLADRATRPRVWARVAPVDPDLPIRGRYVRLRVETDVGPSGAQLPAQPTAVALSAVDNHLVLTIASESTGLYGRSAQRDGRTVAVLDEPLAYFIPEHVPDPSRRPAGEELWVELTLPRHGMPRPIRLGVKKNDRLTPLDLR